MEVVGSRGCEESDACARLSAGELPEAFAIKGESSTASGLGLPRGVDPVVGVKGGA